MNDIKSNQWLIDAHKNNCVLKEFWNVDLASYYSKYARFLCEYFILSSIDQFIDEN